MIKNPYITPITIEQAYRKIDGVELEKQEKMQLVIKNFIYGGVNVKSDIDLKDKFKIVIAGANEDAFIFKFTINELLDTDLGFPKVCSLVVNKWNGYTHLKCPLKIKLAPNIKNNNIQALPYYTVSIDTKSNILLISFMLIFWDIFKEEILKN